MPARIQHCREVRTDIVRPRLATMLSLQLLHLQTRCSSDDMLLLLASIRSVPYAVQHAAFATSHKLAF
ncbi:hypothetical protein KCP73_03665 [Salmonella enterica subsp. enterica]|nr:hypothetical protein KCP73_03665 [Salmonella enterica subsp. enterica]